MNHIYRLVWNELTRALEVNALPTGGKENQNPTDNDKPRLWFSLGWTW